MKQARYLENLIYNQSFRFHRLIINSIDNEKMIKIFPPSRLKEEYCLFSNTIHSGDEYFRLLHERIIQAIQNKIPLPVVRFADGEYAFYRFTLGCNCLYKQAESIQNIKKVMTQHIMAMTYIASCGFLSPLIFPGNSQVPEKKFFSLKKEQCDSTAAEFLDFLRAHHINLTPVNYIPFYVVYAYLSSSEFAVSMNEKTVCILNSDNNEQKCREWFSRFNSHPCLSFIDIPAEYVATRWEEIKEETLVKIHPETDLCLVGAGVGALLVCKDIAEKFSIPAIDAGHILNMMNDRTDKSNSAILYTLRKSS
ncbi:MAG: hypothetical protein ACLQBQ_02535 [Smithella sp.]